jgi:hypothetical protein
MKEMMIITANSNGKRRSLTVPEWSRLLNVSTHKLYNRKTIGLSDQETVDGRYKKDREKIKISEEYLAEKYREFNFSHGVVELWRQKNGIR